MKYFEFGQDEARHESWYAGERTPTGIFKRSAGDASSKSAKEEAMKDNELQFDHSCHVKFFKNYKMPIEKIGHAW